MFNDREQPQFKESSMDCIHGYYKKDCSRCEELNYVDKLEDQIDKLTEKVNLAEEAAYNRLTLLNEANIDLKTVRTALGNLIQAVENGEECYEYFGDDLQSISLNCSAMEEAWEAILDTEV